MNNIVEFNFNLSYLSLPQSQIDAIHHEENYIASGSGKKRTRRLFEGNLIEYDAFEKEQVFNFIRETHKHHITLPMNWTEADSLRFMMAVKFNVDDAMKNLKKHLEWRNNSKFQVLSPGGAELLERGTIYQLGRDPQFRPVIIINADRIDLNIMSGDDVSNALCVLLNLARQYMLFPGKIENFLVLIETNEMNLFKFPFKALGTIVSVISQNYLFSLERLFILNPSFSLNASWRIIESMLSKDTTEKIVFVRRKDTHKILQYLKPNQLERKFGGSLENLNHFWPPMNTLSHLHEDRIEEKFYSITDEASFEGEETYFDLQEEPAAKEEVTFKSFDNRTNEIDCEPKGSKLFSSHIDHYRNSSLVKFGRNSLKDSAKDMTEKTCFAFCIKPKPQEAGASKVEKHKNCILI